MEQNKVLMIVISVAVFLAAIVGVGVALLYPRASDQTTAAVGDGVQEFDPIEYVRQPESAPLTPAEDEEQPMIIVYGEESDTEPEAPEATAAEETATDGDGADATETAGEATPAAAPVVEAPSTRTQPRTFGNTGQATASRPAASVESAPETTATRVTEYWIQLIASPSRDRVEQARDSLEEMSVGGRITTTDVEGTTYYRLRVGPYDSREEADKFLEWIHEVERFTGAYISEEYVTRYLGG